MGKRVGTKPRRLQEMGVHSHTFLRASSLASQPEAEPQIPAWAAAGLGLRTWSRWSILVLRNSKWAELFFSSRKDQKGCLVSC